MPTKRTVPSIPSGFEGFSAEGFRFLRDLAKHNNRAWFTPRKDVFKALLLEPLAQLRADASNAMRKAKVPLGSDPRTGSFRIYRDIRFSADKSPYKTNLGVYFAHNADHDSPGGLYLHIQPKHSFMAAGFYELDRPVLQRWRESMARDPKTFEKMLREIQSRELPLNESHEALKRMPRGFEAHADGTIAKYFRMTSFMASEELSDQDVCSPVLIDRIVELARRAKPLLGYGWSV